MTDTHDLILKYGRWLDTGKHNVDSPQRRAFFEERDAIHARLTAGGAAIKRVALQDERIAFLEAAEARLASSLATVIGTEAQAQIDLAAARAEIERKDAALEVAIVELLPQLRAALAPKE